MSITDSAATLRQALKDLTVDWQQTKSSWRDVKSQQFEKEYLDALPHEIARAMKVMEETAKLLKKVREDCE